MGLNAVTLAGRYKINGNARFLSHQETMRVIQRAIIRSGISMVYSQGFNPHPKFSLPLPKNVGLASDDELFCVQVQPPAGNFLPMDAIGAQLPDGFELISAAIHDQQFKYRAVEVEYLIKADTAKSERQLVSGIEMLNKQIRTGSRILIKRTVNEKGDIKTIDVVKFLKSFEVVAHGVLVFCKILPTGTIRPDEILHLLGVEPGEVGISIVRKQVNWEMEG